MATVGFFEGISPLALILTAIASFISAGFIYRLFLHPLAHVPGPWICRLTSLWTYYHSYVGDDSSCVHELHQRYGPVVRVAPNEVCISDGAALAPIYSEKGGFLKAPCYTNFNIEGHPTIFSALDPAHRALRSKAVLPIFSMASIRNGNAAIEGCVNRFVARLKTEADDSRAANRAGKTDAARINVLNLTRSLALDAVSAYCFGTPFGGVGEKTDKMSASAFVDSLVAVGRFFYVPNWIFLALEASRKGLWPDKEENVSSTKVYDFLDPLVSRAADDESTYQGRLERAGISSHEIKIQCEDIIFAGTDSTGMSLGKICWHLCKQPEIYTALRREIAEADAKDPSTNPQSLRYLDAVVREGLRIAMPNPTRLPRVVPPQGWGYTASDGKSYQFPAGTLVGVQLYTLHFNPVVFPEPDLFKPERWIDEVTPEMYRDSIPFGLGPRQCIARNLATQELFLAVREIARQNVLEGAHAVGEKIEIMEWFNSKVKFGRIDLDWG